MPTVNTLVVERADLLGLGQMHQLRGRVGRSGSRAYAYLFHPPRRAPDRGGLRAAAHDRRGHRPRQRLQDRDARPRDPRRRQPARRVAERPHRRRRLRPLLPDGHRGRRRDEGRAGQGAAARSSSTCRPTRILPKDYVAKEELRLEAYRRLAGVTTAAEVDDIRAEWEDRYGPVPRAGRGAARRRPACAPSATGSGCATCRSRPPGPPGAARAEGQRGDAPAPAEPRRDLQGGRRSSSSCRSSAASSRPLFLVGFLRELIPAARLTGADSRRWADAGRRWLTSSVVSSPRRRRRRRPRRCADAVVVRDGLVTNDDVVAEVGEASSPAATSRRHARATRVVAARCWSPAPIDGDDGQLGAGRTRSISVWVVARGDQPGRARRPGRAATADSAERRLGDAVADDRRTSCNDRRAIRDVPDAGHRHRPAAGRRAAAGRPPARDGPRRRRRRRLARTATGTRPGRRSSAFGWSRAPAPSTTVS